MQNHSAEIAFPIWQEHGVRSWCSSVSLSVSDVKELNFVLLHCLVMRWESIKEHQSRQRQQPPGLIFWNTCLRSHFTLQNVLVSRFCPFLTEKKQECKCCVLINYGFWWLGCPHVSTWPINFQFRKWIFHIISTIKKRQGIYFSINSADISWNWLPSLGY